MQREQFTWHRNYYEALKTLPEEDFKEVVLAICAYALDGEAPSLDGASNSVFTLIRPTLDSGRNKAANRNNKPITNREQTGTNAEQTDIKSATNTEQTANNAEQIDIKLGTKQEESENKPENSCEECDEPQEKKEESSPLAPPSLLSPTPPIISPPYNPPTEKKEREYCAEPQSASAPPVITLTLNDGTGYPVSVEQCQEWAGLYPAVDVIQQLRQMKGWLDANPARRKTRRGISRFIVAWLSKEQDKGRAAPRASSGNIFMDMLREEEAKRGTQ